MRILSATLSCMLSLNLSAQQAENGEVRQTNTKSFQVWSDNKSDWTDLDSFWRDYVKHNQGKYWGAMDTYPNYEQVNEFDTLLIEVKQGACLMQFFHSRWRRANDVQRWHEHFNQHAGCPYVFD